MKLYYCKHEKVKMCDCGVNWMCKKCGEGFGIAPHVCYENSFKRGISDVKEGRVTRANNLKTFLRRL